MHLIKNFIFHLILLIILHILSIYTEQIIEQSYALTKKTNINSKKISNKKNLLLKKKFYRSILKIHKIPRKSILSFSSKKIFQAHSNNLNLKSSVALIIDRKTHEVLFEKNPHVVLPIASITKLMTSLVVIEAGLPLDEVLTISQDDVSAYPGSRRVHVGNKITREDALLLALMASENRASHALAVNYPGGIMAFVRAMNARAKALGMRQSKFSDPMGLSSNNVSSPEDLTRLVEAAYQYKLVREFSTKNDHKLVLGQQEQTFVSTNRLVRENNMKIGLQKTGYISAAGSCLVMQAYIKNRDIVMIFLDSMGKLSRFGDALRVRKWIESHPNLKPVRRL